MNSDRGALPASRCRLVGGDLLKGKLATGRTRCCAAVGCCRTRGTTPARPCGPGPLSRRCAGQDLVFQGGDEQFGGGVVETRPDAAHRLPDAEFVLAQTGDLRDRLTRLTPAPTAPSRNSPSNLRLDSFGVATPHSACLDKIWGGPYERRRASPRVRITVPEPVAGARSAADPDGIAQAREAELCCEARIAELRSASGRQCSFSAIAAASSIRTATSVVSPSTVRYSARSSSPCARW
jgi:hypothetical protein